MRKLQYILALLCLVFVFNSCSDDDDDNESCSEYNERYQARFNALDEFDIEGTLELLAEYAVNLPEGCEPEDFE